MITHARKLPFTVTKMVDECVLKIDASQGLRFEWLMFECKALVRVHKEFEELIIHSNFEVRQHLFCVCLNGCTNYSDFLTFNKKQEALSTASL